MHVPRPVLVLQHAAWESPGLVDLVLSGLPVDRRSVVDDPEPVLPQPGDLAGLVVLGGPQCADDDTAHPGLAAERRLLADAVDAGVPVLGVCLGMQLLGVALGAPLHPGATREIGFGEVELTPPARTDPVLGPLTAVGIRPTVLHWHSDAVDLPAGATLLASTARTPVQAFRAGTALGVQFHPEMDARLLARWLTTPQMRAAIDPEEALSIAGEGAVHLPALRRAAVCGLTELARAMAERG